MSIGCEHHRIRPRSVFSRHAAQRFSRLDPQSSISSIRN